MRAKIHILRRTWFLSLLITCLSMCPAAAGEKAATTLSVKDNLTSPNQSAAIEARLVAKGLLMSAGLGGEPLELVVDGKVVATAMTGGDGKAFLAYTPKAQGVVPVQVRVGSSPRVPPAEGQANLAVWERRNPIVAIEMAALIDEPSLPSPLPAIGLKLESERKPMPDAATELGKLTQFYYRVIYVVASPAEADGFHASTQAREWLKTHKFPTGYVLVLPPGENALGTKIDELHAAGWKTIKTGIGRTKAFAEAFLQRRLEAVIVPEPAKGEAPRKAKVAKQWKEVRKKL
ncbi:MAG: hypothetical protein EWM72_03159 [Nitrospira sp.]|nr:MAG: hypothetical protein EWM72_03159 [Nitrospira sp.]